MISGALRMSVSFVGLLEKVKKKKRRADEISGRIVMID
jgi:hypothetical protein